LSKIYIDADACPVKDEVFRVAERYELDVVLVANTWMNTPKSSRLRLQMVDGKFDAADDWIVDHAQTDDIVITTYISHDPILFFEFNGEMLKKQPNALI